MPFYDKFRAVSSILVIAEFTIPLLAVFALKKIIEEPDVIRKNRRGIIISFCLTAGFALLLALFPGMITDSFVPAQEMQALQKAILGAQLAPVLTNISDVRSSMVSSDACLLIFDVTKIKIIIETL